jgi:hypothetical protein
MMEEDDCRFIGTKVDGPYLVTFVVVVGTLHYLDS